VRRTLLLLLTLTVIAMACTSGSDSGESTTTSIAPTSTAPPSTAAGTADLPPEIADLGAADIHSYATSAGAAHFVGVDWVSGAGAPESAAEAWFETFGAALGVSDPAARLAHVRTDETPAGTVVRFSQTLGGLDVFAGEVAVVVRDGTVTRFVGPIVPDTELPQATVSAEEAAAGLAEFSPGTPTLVVYAPVVEGGPGDPVPAWQVPAVDGRRGVPIAGYALISAVDGTTLLAVPTEESTENWEVHDAGNALDEDGEATLDEAFLVYETVDGTTELASGESDADADAVATNLSQAWNYFFNTHGRDGHDGQGGVCRAYVHVGVDWKNATAGDCRIRFGDGRDYAGSLDVAVHEFTHSVERHIVDLVYQGESGAISEHYADFFAAMVDRSDWAISPTSRVMGETGPLTADDFVITDADDDDGGVHTNSAIGNGVGFTVATEIGRDKAEQIWYQSMFALTPRITYGAWACVVIDTAFDMVGGSITSDDAEVVSDTMEDAGLVEFVDGRWSCGSSLMYGGGDDPEGDGEPTTTTTTGPSAGGACELPGSWELRSQPYLDQLAEAAGAPAGTTFEHVSGRYVVDLEPDGTYTGHRMEWTIRFATRQGTIVFSITSDDPGTWEADDTTLSIVDFGTGVPEVQAWIEVDGELTPVPFSDFGVGPGPGDAFSGSGTYVCVGDVLTVDTEIEGLQFTTVFDRVG
jgi:hypothetical protein